MTRNQKASRLLLLLAIFAALISPTNLLVPAPYWFGLAILLGGSAWAVRAFDQPPPVTKSFDPVEASLEVLERLRLERNRFFRHSPESPLLDEDKATFVALRYFPPVPDFVFIVTPIPTNDPAKLQLPGSDVDFTRWAHLFFESGGQTCRLTVYMGDDGSHFIPFTDETTGEETYGGGRYVDLLEFDDNRFLLDFNRAYNPYCAYNPDFICPLPPEENRLPVAIRAGERNFEHPSESGSVQHPEPAA